MKNKFKSSVLIVIGFVFLTACSNGQVKNTEKTVTNNMAIVKGLPAWNPLSVIAVTIYRIDDKKINKAKNKYELAPGKHEIEVRCSREMPESLQRYFVFDLYLKAGHEYKPRLDMTRDCYVNYIDTDTGKVYTGIEE